MREWQPIETAPRDGTDVHVISKKWLIPVPAHYVSHEYLKEAYGNADYLETGWYPSMAFLFDLPEETIEPTHWMPLPGRPK